MSRIRFLKRRGHTYVSLTAEQPHLRRSHRLSLQTESLSLQTGRFKRPVCRLYATQARFTNRSPVCKLRQPSLQTGKKSVSWFESADGILKETNFLTTHATRSMAENAEQKRLFTEALQKQCGDEDKERTQFLTERKYEQVCAGLEEFYEAGDASAKKAVQKVHSQAVRVGKEVRARRLQRLQGPHLQGRCRG